MQSKFVSYKLSRNTYCFYWCKCVCEHLHEN